MKKMKLIIFSLCLVIFAANSITGQKTIYRDISGNEIRKAEEKTVTTAQNETKKTERLSAQIDLVSKYEQNSRSELAPIVENINFLYYMNACNLYTDNYAKSNCQKEVLYFKDAHNTIANLLKVKTLFKMKKGNQELIKQKYFEIKNTLKTGLESLKSHAEYDHEFSNQTTIKH